VSYTSDTLNSHTIPGSTNIPLSDNSKAAALSLPRPTSIYDSPLPFSEKDNRRPPNNSSSLLVVQGTPLQAIPPVLYSGVSKDLHFQLLFRSTNNQLRHLASAIRRRRSERAIGHYSSPLITPTSTFSPGPLQSILWKGPTLIRRSSEEVPN